MLPFSGPSGADRIPEHGSESLGAHIERPFLSSAKNGIRPLAVLQQTTNGISDLEACYGTSNLKNAALLTAAPERGILQCIPDIVNRGIVFSIGHTEASNEEAEEAVAAGATMITHPFNQMKPFHHRNPGIFGVLGSNGIKTTPPTTPGGKPKRSEYKLPFFSLIADGIHLHSTTVKIAYSVHPDGCILITDAMPIIGLPDGLYTYSPSSSQLIHKTGSKLTLQDSDVLAGSASTLMECVNNFLDWTGVGVAEALATVTEHPARVLGIEDRKGVLATGADADPVVFAEDVDGRRELLVEEVWKFGVKVWAKE